MQESIEESYGHLSFEERVLVQASLEMELSVRAIGRELDRAAYSHMRLSLTYDQGRELAHHEHPARQTGMKVYFAHPHRPGSAASTRTPMGCCASTCPRTQT